MDPERITQIMQRAMEDAKWVLNKVRYSSRITEEVQSTSLTMYGIVTPHILQTPCVFPHTRQALRHTFKTISLFGSFGLPT